jgi:acetyl-CoA carboxylase alpha subunit
MAAALKEAVLRHLRELQAKPRETLLAERSRRLAGFGAFTEGAG